jgi:hypothetical protein
MSFMPTRCSICLFGQHEHAAHAKSWIVAVLVDGENWEEMNDRENNSELYGVNMMAAFETKSEKRHSTKLVSKNWMNLRFRI